MEKESKNNNDILSALNKTYIIILTLLIVIFISVTLLLRTILKFKLSNRIRQNHLNHLYDNEDKLLPSSLSDELIKICINVAGVKEEKIVKEEENEDEIASQTSANLKSKRKIKTRMWLQQLKVVLWKNLIIRKRHWFLTICEALIPVSLFLLIAYGRSKITGLNKREISEVTYSDKNPIIYGSSGINLEDTQLYYTPADDFFYDLIHRVQVKFQITNNNIHGFNTQETLLEEYARSNNNSVIAIIFHSAKESTHLDYTIRCHEQYSSWELYESQYSFVPKAGSQYLWKGFLALQKALDVSFIEKIHGSEQNIIIDTLEFPYPPYKADTGQSSVFIHYLPLITLFSFIFVCPAVLKRVVEEKYSGIKELMKMVGMRTWMLWLGWFIYSMLPMIFSVFLIIIIMKVDLFGVSYPLIEHADAGVLIVFLVLYSMAATVACFFISTLFRKPTLATLVGLLLWILTYFIPKYTLDGNNNISLIWSYTLLLMPNIALHYGYTAVAYYEEREIGINWSNWHTPGGGGSNEITMLNVCVMLIVDVFLYMLFTLYLDGILPGKYGVPKPILFPFKCLKQMATWLGCFFKKNNNVGGKDSENIHLRDVESGEGLNKGIQLRHLTKKYGKKKVVNNLCMDIYKDRITVLLGHNGAGKTTTMGMITGMVKKSSGLIIMDGKKIESSYDVTETIGLCPQHNLFFPDLTVAEHLKFFAMLKGRTCEESKKEINSLLEKLDLKCKANDMAHTLSGGMKRKLCLGMAVVGGSKILILDEPSSGMDPESRRHLWDLLLGWRNDKTILITTHFMEEADALGDWIAIMDEGELRCYGTPMYLKKSYETGYNLNLLIKKDADINDAVKDLKDEISTIVTNAKLKSINGSEVVFLLPFENNYIKMFEHLESNKAAFKIDNMSFTTTTLEDVFLNKKNSAKDEDDGVSDITSINSSGDGHNYGLTFRALFFKRYKFIYWKLQTYLIPCVIALLFLLLCIYLGQGANNNSSSGGPALKMKLNSYGKTTVMFNSSNDPAILKMKDFYGNIVKNENSEPRLVGDVSQGIVNEAIKNLPFYRYHMIAAAEFLLNSEGFEAVAMYNNLAIHSAPISLNLITNTFAKAILGEQYSISTTLHPLDTINSDTTVSQLSEVQIGLLWLIIMPLGFLFFLGSFIYFPFVELSTNFTQLQFMCGCPPWFYWLITYATDLVVFVVFVLMMSIISMAWTPFRGGLEFGALFLILVLYGTCGIPCAYLFGRKKSFSGAYALFIILGIMSGVLLTVVVSVLEESGDKYYMDIGFYLRIVFLIFCPQFGLTYSGVKFSRKVISNYNFDHMPKLKLLTICSRDEPNPCCHNDGPVCQAHKSYLNLLEPDFGWMLLGAGLFLLINVAMHSYWLRKKFNTASHQLYACIQKQKNPPYNPQENDDNDKTNTLKVNRLKKSYSGREVVSNVDFNLKKGECMGILGVNGAGKTTTFRMLTKEEVKDNGEIKINDVNIDENEYLRRLGYCPQNDALNYSLTGRDILKTMAWLRGIKNVAVVNAFLEAFELTKYADIPCEYYSGGNKRKLSFAVAVIGIPDVILLDEPTNGVDPSSKRKFWSLIRNIKDTCKNSFVLTSHSMAECEALCNDLKIMNQGEIRKDGTIAKLRDELNGIDVKMKLKQSADKVPCDEVDGSSSSLEVKSSSSGGTLKSLKDSLKKEVNIRYPLAEIKDEHPGLLHYYIKTAGVENRWSKLFQQFEELKSDFPELIEDYSISEASLEDVFLDVARENKIKTEDLGGEKKRKSKKSLQ